MAMKTPPLIHPLDKHLRLDRVPTMYCPGCGIGIALGAMFRALDRRFNEGLLDPNRIVWVGGIGCSARATLYVNYDAAHVLHGRAIPFALGVILANPNLQVIVIGGDGDIAGIGGNHLIHAAKRNIDMIVVMITNFVYAMTGGQVAPTTPVGVKTTTTPYGNPEPPINVVKVVTSLNANYVARASVTTPHYIESFFYKALGMKGFRLIEIVSTCPEVYGRHIGLRDPVDMYNELKKRVKYKQKPSIEESDISWDTGIVIGEFLERNNPSYLELLTGVRGR
ncbi:MAG: thiamine pyrophosphate-dependent enzyme [Desulfurococcaceae archaeon]|nr:thiamine pyrophosphate-dependent enzyme [Desulfurococcaceae archaeon]